MIKKILVANRGEIAMRIFRTCRVMNISTVAVYTHVDRGALHVRYAEEAYCISESPEDTSYLKPELILSIAKKTGAAIHPGYGFLSENADFARRCEEEGVIFIGPGADIIAKMGIKTEARKIMREAGLPIVPGTEAPVQGIEEVKKVAKEVGYPINSPLLKAEYSNASGVDWIAACWQASRSCESGANGSLPDQSLHLHIPVLPHGMDSRTFPDSRPEVLSASLREPATFLFLS